MVTFIVRALPALFCILFVFPLLGGGVLISVGPGSLSGMDPTLPAVVLLFVAIGSGVWFFVAWNRWWTADDTALSTCRGVFVGVNAVVGRAEAVTAPLISPVRGVRAVWFEWWLFAPQAGAQQPLLIENRASAAPFWIHDETGWVLVRPRGCEVEFDAGAPMRTGHTEAARSSRVRLRMDTTAGEDDVERQVSLTDPWLAGALAPPGTLTYPTGEVAPLGNDDDLTMSERIIGEGQPIYVRGLARPRADGHGLELVADDDEPLIISKELREDLGDRYSRDIALSGLLTLAASALLAALPFWSTGSALLRAAVVVGVELAIVGLIAFIRNVNRQVRVKEQAARAWSLIDVTLRRRADLLPNLVDVVAQYATWEHDSQALFAQARTVPTGASADLPQAQELRSAEAVDDAQQAAWWTATAAAEAYPDLGADALFLDLQARLSDAETTVSSSRWHYNDAINILRDRRQTFPGFLFALFVKVPSWELFTTAPQAQVAPPTRFDHPVNAAGPSSFGGLPAPRLAEEQLPDPSEPPRWPPRPGDPRRQLPGADADEPAR